MTNHIESVFIGVDLGRVNNHSAFAVLTLCRAAGPNRNPVTWQLEQRASLDITHIERVPLGTDYTEVIARLGFLVRRSAMPPQWGVRPPSVYIVVDATGPGQIAVDIIRHAKLDAIVQPIVTTAAEESHRTKSGAISVPRKELLSTLRVLLETGIIRTSAKLRQAEVLRIELSAIRQDGRQAAQDDMVFSAALAAWYATRIQRSLPLAA